MILGLLEGDNFRKIGYLDSLYFSKSEFVEEMNIHFIQSLKSIGILLSKYQNLHKYYSLSNTISKYLKNIYIHLSQNPVDQSLRFLPTPIQILAPNLSDSQTFTKSVHEYPVHLCLTENLPLLKVYLPYGSYWPDMTQFRCRNK